MDYQPRQPYCVRCKRAIVGASLEWFQGWVCEPCVTPDDRKPPPVVEKDPDIAAMERITAHYAKFDRKRGRDDD